MYHLPRIDPVHTSERLVHDGLPHPALPERSYTAADLVQDQAMLPDGAEITYRHEADHLPEKVTEKRAPTTPEPGDVQHLDPTIRHGSKFLPALPGYGRTCWLCVTRIAPHHSTLHPGKALSNLFAGLLALFPYTISPDGVTPPPTGAPPDMAQVPRGMLRRTLRRTASQKEARNCLSLGLSPMATSNARKIARKSGAKISKAGAPV